MTHTLASEAAVEVDVTVKQRLEKFAATAGRSSSSIAADVISRYLDLNEAQVAGIHEAIEEVENGQVVLHGKVKEWVLSWGAAQELPPPTL